jgi:hypothetical protein
MPLALGAAVLATALVLWSLLAQVLRRQPTPRWLGLVGGEGTLAAIAVGGLAFGVAYIIDGVLRFGATPVHPLALGVELAVVAAAATFFVTRRGRRQPPGGGAEHHA